MTQHTSDHRTIAEIICQLPSEAESNARLIAAAPEMMAILHEFVGDYAMLADEEDPESEGGKLLREARALLAKIEGK